MDGAKLTSIPEEGTEVSIYVGSAHNPCYIKELEIRKIGENQFELGCQLFVDFENEGVAPSEEFEFKTQLVLSPESIE